MRDFMREADRRCYRVDYIGVHWYGGTRAEHFKERMRQIYEMYGKRPLLITEFAPADWQTGGDIQKHRHTPAAVLKFMKEVLPWMERQDWVAGYAWFSFKIDSPQGTSSALFDNAGNLTACGRYYRSVTRENPQGDQTIEPDPVK
jgi:O-glycosyl hydrolase